jgi:hypothetical protein
MTTTCIRNSSMSHHREPRRAGHTAPCIRIWYTLAKKTKVEHKTPPGTEIWTPLSKKDPFARVGGPFSVIFQAHPEKNKPLYIKEKFGTAGGGGYPPPEPLPHPFSRLLLSVVNEC